MAYRAIGNPARAEEALQFAQRRLDLLTEQGVDFAGLWLNTAAQHALLGNADAAFEQLDKAANAGFAYSRDPYDQSPEFAALFEDPRFPAVRAKMLANFNANREVLNLPPYGENYQVMVE